MSRKRIESTVAKYLEPIMDKYNYELVDVEYVNEASTYYLRAYIHKDGGVGVDDCEIVSRELDVILEENDPTNTPYILEISSPGLDRPLKKKADFKRNIGNIIEINLYQPIHGSKEHQGELISFEENIVTILTDNNEEIEFNNKDIALAKQAIIF